ncbi:MAG: hypothetical protein PHW73_01220 [Atribacterota bacterium]|nr:hypothetical protein [Atribacterota bacterium]
MAKPKPEIEEFDKLSISDLMARPSKELQIAIFIKIKQVNGKVKWHDKFIWGLISTIGLGIMTAIIVGIIGR